MPFRSTSSIRCAGVVAAACIQGKRTQHGEPHGVAERFAVPLKPGNAGGGKGPRFKTDAASGEGFGDWATYQLRKLFRNCRRRCTLKRRQKPAIASTRCTTRSAVPDERGGNRYALPKATAPHLDSTERPFRPSASHFWSTPINGRHQTGQVGPVSAKRRRLRKAARPTQGGSAATRTAKSCFLHWRDLP